MRERLGVEQMDGMGRGKQIKSAHQRLTDDEEIADSGSRGRVCLREAGVMGDWNACLF